MGAAKRNAIVINPARSYLHATNKRVSVRRVLATIAHAPHSEGVMTAAVICLAGAPTKFNNDVERPADAEMAAAAIAVCWLPL